MSLGRSSRNFISTFTADSTTAELAWERRGVTRSQILKETERGSSERWAGIFCRKGLLYLFSEKDNLIYFLLLRQYLPKSKDWSRKTKALFLYNKLFAVFQPWIWMISKCFTKVGMEWNKMEYKLWSTSRFYPGCFFNVFFMSLLFDQTKPHTIYFIHLASYSTFYHVISAAWTKLTCGVITKILTLLLFNIYINK